MATNLQIRYIDLVQCIAMDYYQNGKFAATMPFFSKFGAYPISRLWGSAECPLSMSIATAEVASPKVEEGGLHFGLRDSCVATPLQWLVCLPNFSA